MPAVNKLEFAWSVSPASQQVSKKAFLPSQTSHGHPAAMPKGFSCQRPLMDSNHRPTA
ncbi:hypothetical protein SynBOUM118_02071 [Synechococcus sp. BOUM118]|nr:hypothetical protein SynBOUM118_02071 [Synechococcus sp. BOUM118]